MNIEKWLTKADGWVTQTTKTQARQASRRQFMTRLGKFIVGVSLVPVLPIARSSASEPAGTRFNLDEIGDPQSCEYWRYCAIDGFLCSCCGGTASKCPPGAEPSPVTWVGTCENPADGQRYIISYNDCCGKSGCDRCFCNRNEGDKPSYYPAKNNDINWCVGTKSNAYHCSTAVVVAVDAS